MTGRRDRGLAGRRRPRARRGTGHRATRASAATADTALRGEIAELYEEHVWGVYGFFGYRVGSRADAEDLTQLTFERALRAWDRFDPERASARTWLMSIAGNLLIDHYRRDRSGASRSRSRTISRGGS